MLVSGVRGGRGRVSPEPGYVTVVGGANLDISGAPFAALIDGDSNPGLVTAAPGGVGRNIAENLARLGVPVKLLTAVGDDANGTSLLEETARAGVDIGHVRRVSDAPTGVYLSVLDENRDMAVAVSSMEVLKWLDAGYLRENDEILRGGRLTVFDANLTFEALEAATGLIAGHKIVLDPVSVTKAIKAKDLLGRFYCIKPNRKEAEALTGLSAGSPLGLRRNADAFHDMGVSRVFISLGSEGVYFSDGTERGIAKALSAEIRSATGAGDAFLAGVVYSELAGLGIAEAAVFGTGAALLALAAGDTTSKNISPESIKSIMETNCEIIRES